MAQAEAAARRRLFGLYEGEVTQRNDPEGLGRVKILLPGLIEPETPDWVWPIGSPGGGSAQKGSCDPPAQGATVAVFFKHGEPEHPRYIPGPWGTPGGVSDGLTGVAVEGVDRQRAVTEDAVWLVIRDSRSGERRWQVQRKGGGNGTLLGLLLNAETDTVHIARPDASEGLVKGTAYRAAEVTFLTSFISALATFCTALGGATDPAVTGAASALATALGTLGSDPMAATPTEHVSTKAFTE
jgi:hypothetical protein